MSKEIVYSLLKNCPFVVDIGAPSELTDSAINPYKSISDVLQILKLFMEDAVPKWIKNTNSLVQSTAICSAVVESEIGDERKFYKRNDKPKTLICHDYAGNYHAFDCQYDPPPPDDCFPTYEFTNWMGIDIFVYFSHHFITIPPPHWINQAHKHGVAILGTLITENEDGKALCDDIFETEEKWKWFAEALNAVAVIHKFDGYLINIENPLSVLQVQKMIEFLAYLKSLMLKTSYLIWYDAVTLDGKLKWQDALNENNQDFFNVCDGIFLNYNIDVEKLEKSAEYAGKRTHDVFVGIDVFGRSKAPGRFLSRDGFAMARNLELSVALFAPAWTVEASPGGSLLNDFIFWTSLRPYLYFHGVKKLICTDRYCDNILCCLTTPPPADAPIFRDAVIKMSEMDKIEDVTVQAETAAAIYRGIQEPIMAVQSDYENSLSVCLSGRHLEFQLLVLEIIINQVVTVTFTNNCTGTEENAPTFFMTLLDREKQLIKIHLTPGETVIEGMGTLVEFGVSCNSAFNLGPIGITLSHDRASLDIRILKPTKKVISHK